MPKFQYIQYSWYLKLGRRWFCLLGKRGLHFHESETAKTSTGIHRVAHLRDEVHNA